jgi:hypothetical protein
LCPFLAAPERTRERVAPRLVRAASDAVLADSAAVRISPALGHRRARRQVAMLDGSSDFERRVFGERE